MATSNIINFFSKKQKQLSHLYLAALIHSNLATKLKVELNCIVTFAEHVAWTNKPPEDQGMSDTT